MTLNAAVGSGYLPNYKTLLACLNRVDLAHVAADLLQAVVCQACKHNLAMLHVLTKQVAAIVT